MAEESYTSDPPAYKDRQISDEEVANDQDFCDETKGRKRQRTETRIGRWLRSTLLALYWAFALSLFLSYTGITPKLTAWWQTLRVENSLLHGYGQLFGLRQDCHRHEPYRTIVTPEQAEEIFMSSPDPQSAKNALKGYTSQAHLAGTSEDHESALQLEKFIAHHLGAQASRPRDFGQSSRLAEVEYQKGDEPHVWIDTYYPYINYPISHSLTLFDASGSESYKASLTEDQVEEDQTSMNNTAVLTWHGLSANGTARGQLVYANSGSKEDYQCLEDRGIDLKGKIVITKYSGVFRGIKVARAAERGAIGVIIYSDPQQDGEMTEANGYQAYPDGPARQPSSVQRGSVQNLPLYPGDPTTPGRPADKPDVERDEPTSIPTIPSLPISYQDALPLLQSLIGKGECAKFMGDDWAGAIPNLDYWTGPSEGEVELVNNVEWKVSPVWNVMATIPGRIKDEVVILGNHRDAWVFGGADPSSGSATLHEIIKGFGQLLEKGWKPLRTIMIASWDAEEYGLMGSTEFGENYPEWLSRHVVAYLNVDVGVAGTIFKAGASPLLDQLIYDVTKQVPSPSGNKTLYDTWAQSAAKTKCPSDQELDKPDIMPLGSGSDFTVFLQSLGIASADLGFIPGPKDPIYHYHSNFDSFHWMSKFGDPSFDYHRAISQVLGLMTLRLADSVILPMRSQDYAQKLKGYVEDLEDQWSCHQDENGQRKVNFKHMFRAVDRIRKRAYHLDSEADDLRERLKGHRRRVPPFDRLYHLVRARMVNRRLFLSERGFLDPWGIPGREFYKHIVYAPGLNKGYESTMFPMISEAENVEAAQLAEKGAAKFLNRVARILKKG